MTLHGLAWRSCLVQLPPALKAEGREKYMCNAKRGLQARGQNKRFNKGGERGRVRAVHSAGNVFTERCLWQQKGATKRFNLRASKSEARAEIGKSEQIDVAWR